MSNSRQGQTVLPGSRSKTADRQSSDLVSSSSFNHQDLRQSVADVTSFECRGNTAAGWAQRPGLMALALLGGRVHRYH